MLPFLFAAALLLPHATEESTPEAGAPGGPGLALRAAKVITATLEGRGVVDHGVVLVRDGLIEAVGPAHRVEVPEGYELVDAGDRWLMPGLVDLHCHVAASRRVNDINDGVFQTNPGLRAACAVTPANANLARGTAGGVTTVLFIPGSGNAMGGAGVLLKTGGDRYEDILVRDPGSLKIAQGDNPTRWGYGMGRGLINHHLRVTVRQGVRYARAWERYEEGEGPKPVRDIRLDIFRDLVAREAQISAHTQIYQLVLQTMLIFKGEFGLDVFIDHGSFDSFRAAPLAIEMDVPAILGPRQISTALVRGCQNDHQGAILQGMAEGFQSRGHRMIGFNTDSNVMPQEELSLQAAMAKRYGMDDSRMEAVRGLTIVPAITAGIDDRVGSLEPGKHADILLLDGDVADPRTSVDVVWIEGRRVFDRAAGAPVKGF